MKDFMKWVLSDMTIIKKILFILAILVFVGFVIVTIKLCLYSIACYKAKEYMECIVIILFVMLLVKK